MVWDSAPKPRRVLDSATFAPEPGCWAGSSSSTPSLARDHWFDSSSRNHSSGRIAPSRCPSDSSASRDLRERTPAARRQRREMHVPEPARGVRCGGGGPRCQQQGAYAIRDRSESDERPNVRNEREHADQRKTAEQGPEDDQARPTQSIEEHAAYHHAAVGVPGGERKGAQAHHHQAQPPDTKEDAANQ